MLLNHRLALNPNSGKESSNQSTYGRRPVPELSFKCRLMNSGAGCAHEHHIFNNLTDTPANLGWGRKGKGGMFRGGIDQHLRSVACWVTAPPETLGHPGQVHSSETIRS